MSKSWDCQSYIMGQTNGSSPLGTLEKCVQILTLLADSPSLSVAEIAETMGLPRSTAYRYVAALKAHLLVEDAEEGPGYCLGPKILELASTMSRRPLREVARPYLERIGRETGETIILCGFRDHVGVCLEKVEGHHALRVSYELGDAYPLHTSATGKAIYAYLDPKERKQIIKAVGLEPMTPTTITDPSVLEQEAEKIRERGYSESHGEAIEGTRGIAAPIFSFSGRVVASIGASVPQHRGTGENRARLISLLRDAAEQITQELTTQEVQPTSTLVQKEPSP
jgi:DNA-binding IclR family transcriptional regulator